MAIIRQMMPDAVRWYDQNVSDVSRRYKSVVAETANDWLIDVLPNAPALVLDVGADLRTAENIETDEGTQI